MGRLVFASGINAEEVVYVWDSETFDPMGEIKVPHQEMVRTMIAIDPTTVWMGSADKGCPLSLWTVMDLNDRVKIKKQKRKNAKNKKKKESRVRTIEQKERQRKRVKLLQSEGIEPPRKEGEEERVPGAKHHAFIQVAAGSTFGYGLRGTVIRKQCFCF